MKHRFLFIIFLIFLISLSNAATMISMTNKQIKRAFVGKTLTSIGIDNLNGKTINTNNIVYLDRNGNAYGKLGLKPKGLPQYDDGKYQINEDGSFNITWQHWDFTKKLCFYIFETKNAYLCVDCNGVYHSTFMKAAIHVGNTIRQSNVILKARS